MDTKYNEIKWDDEYKIGHEKVDSEHKYLFDIATEILDSKGDIEKIKVLIKKLIRYTKTHFLNEENYMRSIKYTNLPAHLLLHKKILNNLDIFIKSLNTLSVEQISDQLIEFINVNILNHIIVEDKKVHHFRRTREELKNIFKWKSVYKIGDDKIDEEHHKLFDIAIKAVNYDGADVKLNVKKIILELYDYMKTHFNNEENFMKKIDYPNLQEHIKLHEIIIEQMNLFIKELSSFSSETFERKLIEYIDIWLVNHIIHEDKKIALWQQESQLN